jgi:hypothetical protein
MKIPSSSTLTAGLAAILIVPALAIEAPPDTAPPPPTVQAPANGAALPDTKPATAFLGVVSSEVPAMLASHLGLKPGEGILVQSLMPDGPAAKAGIAVHDVITRVAKIAIASPADLSTEVTAHQPGEKLPIGLIHQGKPTELEVTLGTRPAGVAANDPRPLDQLNLDGIPKALADRVRGMIEGSGMDLPLDNNGLNPAPQAEMNEAMREMKLRMEQAIDAARAAGNPKPEPGIHLQQGATIRLMDDQGSIELRSNNDGKDVTLRDKDNKIIWTGPWDTPQDKAAAPEQVRQRLERINLDGQFQGKGLRLNFKAPLAPPAPPAEDDK